MKLTTFLGGATTSYLRRYIHGEVATDTKVLVFPDARTIYVPIPKAANSSARRALFPLMGLAPKAKLNVHSSEAVQAFEQPASTALPMAGPDWFVFSIVRHPFDRAYSAWNEKLARRDIPFKALKPMGLEPGDSFETFLRVCSMWPRARLNDHFIPQNDLLRPAMAKRAITIFKLEKLATAWPEICDRIQAQYGPQSGPRPSDLLHMHSFAKGKPRQFSRTETRLLHRLYGRDLSELGYKYPTPNLRR